MAVVINGNGNLDLPAVTLELKTGATVNASLDLSGNFVARGNVTAYSDSRFKKDLEPIEDALRKVQLLTGYTYTRTDIEDEPRQIGLVAQEVLEVVPEAVVEDYKGRYAVAYGNLIGLLVEAIKQQQEQIETLHSEIQSLKGNL